MTRYYNRWAGDPKGVPEDTSRCVAEVAEPGRGLHFYQCSRKRGHGPDGLMCSQHYGMTVRGKVWVPDDDEEASRGN